MRRLLAGALAIAGASCRGCAEEPGRHARPSDAREEPPAEHVSVEAFRSRARVPAIGWATMTRHSVSEGASGLADVESGEPASATTAFEAASIAKTVIATCVMQLVDDHKIDLDGDVSQHVGFVVRHPDASAPITLRQLLTHTASISDLDETRARRDVPLGDFLARYFVDAGSRGVFLDAVPGTRSAYSNVGASLAALVVERVAGSPFDAVARARIFEPLRMTTTAFGRDALPARARAAAPYVAAGSGFVRQGLPSHALYPVVDLFSSPHDLARFARAILCRGELDGARILAPKSVDAMLELQLPDAAPAEALGWQLRTFRGRTVVGHEGEDTGASTGLYLDMVAGAGALVLANGDAFQSGLGERAAAIGELLENLLESARSSSASESTLRSEDAD